MPTFCEPTGAEPGARFGKNILGVVNVDSALLRGGLSIRVFRGTPAPRSPGQERVPACPRAPHLPVSQLAVYMHPPHPPGEEGGWQRLQGFLPLRGSVYQAWQSPGAPALSGPSLPCPKGHHSQTRALWGPRSCSQRGRGAGRAGEPGLAGWHRQWHK